MNDLDFGTIELHLKELMEKRNLTLSELSFRAEMQRTQLKHYYTGAIQRLDLAVLSRLCHALDCDITELLEYIPPQQNK